MSRLIKSHKALTYTELFNSQVDRQSALPLEGDVAMEIHIYYASRRPDLDESLILDLLQGVAYTNDRQVKQRHAYWHLDPQNPRALIRVWGIEAVEPKKRPRTKAGSVSLKEKATAQQGDTGQEQCTFTNQAQHRGKP